MSLVLCLFVIFQKLTFDLSYLNDFIPVLHVISEFDHLDAECGSIITKREICWILVRRTLRTFPFGDCCLPVICHSRSLFFYNL